LILHLDGAASDGQDSFGSPDLERVPLQISLYAAAVQPFLQILECQNSLVHKGAAHAEANGIAPEKILRARRDSRDESFRRHIVLGATAAIQVTVMLSGKKSKIA
jgi:hypothetical protein